MREKLKARKRKTKKKRIFLAVIFTPISIYLLWMSYLLINFKTYKITSVSSPFEIEGAFHIHTKCSDGFKIPEAVAKTASSVSMDFIILIDHGNPNRLCLDKEGWKEGVLVLTGSELWLDSGHLIALNYDIPDSDFSRKTDIASQQIINHQGFSVVAHPYSPNKPWKWGGLSDFTGIEIFNGNSQLRKKLLSSLPYFPMIFVSPKVFLLKMIDYPNENLYTWDQLNTHNHKVFGYFGLDAHLFYRPLISYLRLHLPLEFSLSSDFEEAKYQVYDALKHGRFYNAIDAAAQADGFNFWAEKGNKILKMGENIIIDAPVTLKVSTPFPFSVETSLIRNGQHIFKSREKQFSFEVKNSGTYRVEVFLRERTPLRKNIPWIVSNPIFIEEAIDKKVNR